MNFTNITCIGSNDGVGECLLPAAGPPIVIELGALLKATDLEASRYQSPQTSVFVDWFGDPLGSRISPDSLWNGSMRITLKNLSVTSSLTQ